jgi:cell division protein FtsN
LKEKQVPKRKKRSFLKMGLGVMTLAGLILIGMAVVRSWEKPKIPETRNKMVSFRIIDVPYKGQILQKDKGERSEDSTLKVKRKADSLSGHAIETGVPLKEPLEPKIILDVTGTVSEDESSQAPIKLKEKFVAVVKSLDDVSIKAKAVAAEIPELGQQETATQPLSTETEIEKPVFEEKASFTVQVGVFRNEAYAHRKAAKLKQLDYPSFIQEVVGKDQHPLYLVCFGRFSTRKEVDSAMSAFKEKENMDAVVAFLESQ